MSSLEYLKLFVNQRLTAAAEEIFGVFQQKISEYEEEIGRQRKLMRVIQRPVISLQRTDPPKPAAAHFTLPPCGCHQNCSSTELPQQKPCEEEVPDLQLCKQERYSSLNQEDKESPKIEVKQEEPCSSQEGEQLEVKQESVTFMLTSVYEENDHSEVQTVDTNPDDTLEGSVDNMTVISPVASDLHSELQPLSNSSQVASIKGQKGEKCEDSGSTKNVKLRKKKCHVNNVCNPTMFITRFNREMGRVSCNQCGKEFKFRSGLKRHLRIHTGEKPYVCTICGKAFSVRNNLSCHIRIHTGERPYVCTTCGKAFRFNSNLSSHMISHTGEFRHVCTTCGKGFSRLDRLSKHMKLHRAEKSHMYQTHVLSDMVLSF